MLKTTHAKTNKKLDDVIPILIMMLDNELLFVFVIATSDSL